MKGILKAVGDLKEEMAKTKASVGLQEGSTESKLDAIKKANQDSINEAMAAMGKRAPAASEKEVAKKQFEEMREIS